MDKWMDERTGSKMDGLVVKWMDECMEGRVGGLIDG